MKQFYETYKDDEIVTPLVTQISWTNHLLIMSGSKSTEERRFYMQLCIKENYSKRELERQIDSAYYQRYMLSAKKPLFCSLVLRFPDFYFAVLGFTLKRAAMITRRSAHYEALI